MSTKFTQREQEELMQWFKDADWYGTEAPPFFELVEKYSEISGLASDDCEELIDLLIEENRLSLVCGDHVIINEV